MNPELSSRLIACGVGNTIGILIVWAINTVIQGQPHPYLYPIFVVWWVIYRVDKIIREVESKAANSSLPIP
jgi:hypothetical protein